MAISLRFSCELHTRQVPHLASLALTILLSITSTLAQVTSTPPQHQAIPHAAVTGTSGTQTGVANFQGNFTTVSTPTGALVLGRKANCSLGLATGTYTLGASLTYTETELVSNYEQTLHTEAGLTTTPDVFATPCTKQPPLGFGSKPGVFMGTTTSGIKVFAGIGLVQPSLLEGIYILSGNTTFSTTSFAFNTVGDLATGDLNKDGNGDLIVTDNALASAAHVTVFLGNADGSIQNGVAYPIAGNYSIAAVVDDVNGDGNPDIVAVSGDQQISVLLGKGDGTFQAAQSFAAPALPGYPNAAATPIVSLITANLRGAGKRDIVASNGLVLLNSGTGTFTAAANPAFPFIVDLNSFSPTLSAGDVNNDGKIDLVVNDGYIAAVWLGNGDGTFTQGARYGTINQTGFTTVTDLDGDGNADIFVGLGDGGYLGGDEGSANLAYALMGNGDGTFQGAPATDGGAYNGNNVGDVNGDAVPDLVTVSGGTFIVQTGNGKGGFTTKSTFSAPASFSLNGNTYTGANTAVSAYAVGDVNGDGKADVVFVDNNLTEGPTLSATPIYFVALSNGDGTFQPPVPYAFPQIATGSNFDNSATVSSVQIADLQHNGRPDLIFVFNEQEGGTSVAKPYNQGFVVLTGNGNGTFGTSPIITTTYSSATAPTTANPDTIAVIADLNNDEIPDLIVNVPAFSVSTGATTSLQVFVGNGDGTFKAPGTVSATGNPTISVEVADFNKDGKPDLAFLAETSSSQAELVIALGNGNGTFGAATVSDLSGGDGILSASLAAADFDADGKIDLALLNNNEFSGIFYGNGDGTFSNVNTGSFIVPKDLIYITAGGPIGAGSAIALDLNKDGKPDIVDGNVILLNHYGTSTTPTAATPTFSPAAGTYASAQSVTISDTTSGATIYYTTDGSTPSASSTKYAAAISVTSSETIQAIAVASGYADSAVASATYTLQQSTAATPTFSPAAGTFTAAQSVTISDTTSGASIYYTTDSSTPTTSSTKYTGAISVSTTTTIKAMAAASGYNNSAVASATYTINLPPDFSVATSPSTLDFSFGQSGTETVTVSPLNGFNAQVSFACGGLPANTTCTFSPASVTPSGAAASTQLTVANTGSAGAQHKPLSFLPETALAFLLCGFGFARNRRTRNLFLAFGAVVLIGFSGCGGSSKKKSTTATVTVTATAGSVQHTSSFTLTLQ